MEYKNIIIDSSVIISFFNEDDSNHQKALLLEKFFYQEQYMPDIIFYETLSVLKTKIKNKLILNKFLLYGTESSQITIRLFYEYNREVLKNFIHETSGRLSYVDSLLVYLSHEYKILTFDDNLKNEIKKVGGHLV